MNSDDSSGSARPPATAPRQDQPRPARKGRRRFRPRFRRAPRRADDGLVGVLVRAAGTVCRTQRDARVPLSYSSRWLPSRLVGPTSKALITKAGLSADRQRRLQDLPGWTWDPYADQWEEGFGRLLDYIERNGDARVPKSYIVDGYRLGRWVLRQRNKHAKGTLDADRQRRLQEVPGWTWDLRADKWEEGFDGSWTTSNAKVTPASPSPTRSTATSSACGSTATLPTLQRHPYRPTVNVDSRTCPAGLGPPGRQVGGGFSPAPGLRRTTTVTPASRIPTRSMAIRSASGWSPSAATMPVAGSGPIVNAGSRTCPAGRGIHTPTSGNRASTGCWTTGNSMVMPALRSPTRCRRLPARCVGRYVTCVARQRQARDPGPVLVAMQHAGDFGGEKGQGPCYCWTTMPL